MLFHVLPHHEPSHVQYHELRQGLHGMAQGVSEDILADLRANFEGECSEVGMYLAMARVAHREGYPEIGLYWEKAAYEEAEHAAKFAELCFENKSMRGEGGFIFIIIGQ